MNTNLITPNTLAFLALANEYCQAVEHCRETDRTSFVGEMLRLLPRIYIAASDIPEPAIQAEASYIPEALNEDYYESVRRGMEELLGEEDTYLEVFENDMKYSDTPIGASVAESLADLFQVLYNCVEAAKDAPEEIIAETIDAVKEDFGSYWSQILCNVMRPLNTIKYQNL